VKNARLHSWFLAVLLALSSALSHAAAGFCFGPFCMNSDSADSKPGVPLLYADPGVRIERPSQGEMPYRAGMELQIGDIIQTGTGYAVVNYGGDNQVALRDNTRVQLGSIKLFLGEVFARINQLAQRGGGQVTTDELSASVKGTEYSVRRTRSADTPDAGNTAVIVRRGRVLCEDPANRWSPQELPENTVLRVDTGQPPQPPQYIDARAETAWADEAFKRLLRTSGPPPRFDVIIPSQPHREQPRERTPPPPKRSPTPNEGRNY
jgi:hypothetical protein